MTFWILRGCRNCCSFPEKGRAFPCRAGAHLVTVLREDVAAVSLGQRISHFLCSLSVCSEHTVGNLTRKALVLKAASDVPSLLWGSLPPILCQNWEKLCTSSSRHHSSRHSSRKGEWAGKCLLGKTAPGGLRVQKMMDGSCGPIPDVHPSLAVLVFQ